jgi:hypothetical protein
MKLKVYCSRATQDSQTALPISWRVAYEDRARWGSARPADRAQLRAGRCCCVRCTSARCRDPARRAPATRSPPLLRGARKRGAPGPPRGAGPPPRRWIGFPTSPAAPSSCARSARPTCRRKMEPRWFPRPSRPPRCARRRPQSVDKANVYCRALLAYAAPSTSQAPTRPSTKYSKVGGTTWPISPDRAWSAAKNLWRVRGVDGREPRDSPEVFWGESVLGIAER